MKTRKCLFVLGLVLILVGVGFLKIGRVYRVEKEEEEEKVFKVAVVSDVHGDWENLNKALKKAKTEGVWKVILLGDLTTIGKKEELLKAKAILDQTGVDYSAVPGNHDIWWGRKYKKDVWEEVFGESFTAFEKDGFEFILINNGDGIRGIDFYKNGFGESQGKWLEGQLPECLKIACLIFAHIPFNHPYSFHIMGEESGMVASEGAVLKKELVKNQVKEVFAGHLHFSSSYEMEGLKTTVVGALTRERNLQSPKFLILVFKGKEIEKKEIFLEEN